MRAILTVLFLCFLILPITFQIIFGTLSLRKRTTMKFWLICLVSVIGQISFTVANMYIMVYFINHSEIREGLPVIGVIAFGSIMGAIMLIVMLIQTILLYKKSFAALKA